MCGRFVRKGEPRKLAEALGVVGRTEIWTESYNVSPGSLVPREEGRTYPFSQVGYYACHVVMKVHKLTHGIMYKNSTPYMTIKDQGTQTSKWVNGTYRLECFVF